MIKLRMNKNEPENRIKELELELSNLKSGIIATRESGNQKEQALMEINDKFLTLADNISGYIAYINANTLQYEFIGKSTSYETTFDFPSGKRWLQVNFTPVIDTNGHVVSIAVLNFDITECKQAEESLVIQYHISDIFLTAADTEMFNEVLKVILEAMKSQFGIFGYIDEYGACMMPTMTRQIWDECRIPDKTFRFPRET